MEAMNIRIGPLVFDRANGAGHGAR